MRNQLGHLTLMLLATSVSLVNICGCANRMISVDDIYGKIASDIIGDLDLPERETNVVQLTTEGDRDVAIVLSKSNEQYTLWCVFRSREERDRSAGDWKLWIYYEIIEDGTGVEEPAKREYSEMPDTETIAAFKSDMLKHWSNR
jgi:hypothetical protein